LLKDFRIQVCPPPPYCWLPDMKMMAHMRAWGQQAKWMPRPTLLVIKGRSSPVTPVTKTNFDGVLDVAEGWSRQSTGEPDPLASLLESTADLEETDEERVHEQTTIVLGTFEHVLLELLRDGNKNACTTPALVNREMRGKRLSSLEHALESGLSACTLSTFSTKWARDEVASPERPWETQEVSKFTIVPYQPKTSKPLEVGTSFASLIEISASGVVSDKDVGVSQACVQGDGPDDSVAFKQGIRSKFFSALEKALSNSTVEEALHEIAREMDSQGCELGAREPSTCPALGLGEVKEEVRGRFFSSIEKALDNGALEDVLRAVSEEEEEKTSAMMGGAQSIL